jgi:hypothetical protein
VSGKKYQVKELFAKVHLNKETQFLGHCIGDSDTYLEAIERGEIRIFSVRDAEDIPCYTIEYNVKDKKITQFQGMTNDEYGDDLIYDDQILLIQNPLNAIYKSGVEIESMESIQIERREELNGITGALTSAIIYKGNVIIFDRRKPDIDLLLDPDTKIIDVDLTTTDKISISDLLKLIERGVSVWSEGNIPEFLNRVVKVKKDLNVSVGVLRGEYNVYTNLESVNGRLYVEFYPNFKPSFPKLKQVGALGITWIPIKEFTKENLRKQFPVLENFDEWWEKVKPKEKNFKFDSHDDEDDFN